MNAERRIFTLDVLEARKDAESGLRKLSGHAAVFNREADLGWFREKILPGSFKESIVADDIRALFNHDPNFVLGRNKSGTLRLAEDEIGLAIENDPPDTQWARDLLTSIERRDITQMSFGFQVIDQRWETKDGVDLRVIARVKLWDISPVTFPAYLETDVDVARRSFESWQQAHPAPRRPMKAALAEKISRLNAAR